MRRSLGRWLPLLIAIACGGGCYSRQLLPAMTIRVRDQQDRPVAGLGGDWSGYASEGDVMFQPFVFGPDGCARIPRYDLRANVLGFAGAAVGSVLPAHLSPGSLRPTTTDVHVSLPEGYEVDEAATDLKRNDIGVSGGGVSWDGWDDMTFYLSYGRETMMYEGPGVPPRRAFPGRPKPPDQFVITLWKPGARPAVELRLVLRPKAATRPATQPARPGGAGG